MSDRGDDYEDDLDEYEEDDTEEDRYRERDEARQLIGWRERSRLVGDE